MASVVSDDVVESAKSIVVSVVDDVDPGTVIVLSAVDADVV